MRQTCQLGAAILKPMRPPLRDRKFADSSLEGSGFETSVPGDRQVLRRNPNSFREIDKARRLGTVAILARNRKFESIPLPAVSHANHRFLGV